MLIEQFLWQKVSHAACHKVLNHMSAAIKCKLLLYAEELVLLASGNKRRHPGNFKFRTRTVNDWLINNNILFRLDKAQSIVFGKKIKLCKYNTLT